MEPGDAELAIRLEAARFGAGAGTIRDMWARFHGNLHDLCRDGPLSDEMSDFLVALERWEVAVGPEREAELQVARSLAALRR
jgi:hypothetical protein